VSNTSQAQLQVTNWVVDAISESFLLSVYDGPNLNASCHGSVFKNRVDSDKTHKAKGPAPGRKTVNSIRNLKSDEAGLRTEFRLSLHLIYAFIKPMIPRRLLKYILHKSKSSAA
jgi:hypothetical protein